jgi:AcrR family transcriptional regulator
MDPKSQIVAAAAAVFTRHGFRQTAMAMVAEEAGLSRQALYHHFASKEALFAALVDALHEAAFAAAKDAAVRARGEPADAIFYVMRAYHQDLMMRVAGSPFAAELIEESGRQCGAAVSAHARAFEKELENVVAGLVRGGRLKLRAGVDARDVVEMVQVASKGAKAAHAGEGEAKYARALKRMVEVICAGVAQSGAPARTESRVGTARRLRR